MLWWCSLRNGEPILLNEEMTLNSSTCSAELTARLASWHWWSSVVRSKHSVDGTILIELVDGRS